MEKKAIEKEVKRQKELVKLKFYPYLLANTTSVEDAKQLLEMTYGAIQEVFQVRVMEFQKKLSAEKLSSLEILKVMKDNAQTKRERDLITIFQDETVGTADALLVGMKKDIEGRIREEGAKRKLDTVETDFDIRNDTEH